MDTFERVWYFRSAKIFGKADERERQVNKYDTQDSGDKSTELGLRDSVGHADRPALVETFTTDPPMDEEADYVISGKTWAKIPEYIPAMRQRRGQNMG